MRALARGDAVTWRTHIFFVASQDGRQHEIACHSGEDKRGAHDAARMSSPALTLSQLRGAMAAAARSDGSEARRARSDHRAVSSHSARCTCRATAAWDGRSVCQRARVVQDHSMGGGGDTWKLRNVDTFSGATRNTSPFAVLSIRLYNWTGGRVPTSPGRVQCL